MAFDAFLKVDGIEGESTDEGHAGEIEIASYKFGVSQPSAGTRGGGASAATRAQWTDFSIVKALDKSSPKFVEYCAKAKKIGTVTLTLCRATSKKDKYMEYKLSDVIVSSVAPGGDRSAEEALPTETINFNYGKIKVSYIETDHKTGRPKGTMEVEFNVAENK